MDASLTKFNKSQLDGNNFACIRYPPPLEQRRSSETDLRLNQRTIISSRVAVLQCIRPDLAANVCEPAFASLDQRKKVMTLPAPQQAHGYARKTPHARHVRARHESRA